MRKILAFLICAFCAIASRSADFREIRAMAKAGADVVLPEGSSIEGVVVSDFRSGNLAADTQTGPAEYDHRTHFCVAYIQNDDASLGFRILFQDLYDNRAPLNSRVRLDLGGAVLNLDGEPAGYTISGLEIADIEILSRDAKPAEKLRYISELGPEDLYTQVTLRDVEFLSKEGSLTNVYEALAQRNSYNDLSTGQRSRGIPRCADVSGCTVVDSQGSSIFLPINLSLDWRRNWKALPQGVGRITGVLVNESIPRYDVKGRMSLRIAGPEAIAIPSEKASSYVTVAEWNWDDNREDALRLETQGTVEWIYRRSLDPDRILPDLGKGALYTTAGSRLGLADDYNTRDPQAGNWPMQGNRHYSALTLSGRTSDWFKGGAAIVVEASTAGVSGSGLQFGFTWAAGDPSWGFCAGFPSQWRLAYSVDGRNFIPLDHIFSLHPMISKDQQSEVAAPGYVENVTMLPAFLLGKEKIWLRILLASNSLSSSDGRPAVFSGAEDPEYLIRIGRISLKALK